MTVEAVERQWRTPTGMGFRVRTACGSRFSLVYKQASDNWTVSPHTQPVT